ncbi:hypothetical protein B0H11DRAFT_2185423 [Mycena galericulata]|nr:hypothetical protein B0H11DRAFT_2185423 [Mycena galericulata]
MDHATAKFQHALPYALLSISPSLSALHSVRVKASSNACHQCGCALHRGESTVRSIRSNGSRAVQTTCLVCGWVQTLPIPRGNATLYPRTRKRGVQSGNADDNVTIEVDTKPPKLVAMLQAKDVSKQSMMQVNPPIVPQPSPQTGTPATVPKSRPKKKGGLQSMLERNRERQIKDKQSGSGQGGGGGGLAMFLNNL